MWVYRPMTSSFIVQRERTGPALLDISYDEARQIIPQPGCIPAEPASVSPGRFIVAPPPCCLNFRFARDPLTIAREAITSVCRQTVN
jgi:hypothetical protein